MSLMTDRRGREIDATRSKLPSGLSIWTVSVDGTPVGKFWRGANAIFGATLADFGHRDVVIGTLKDTNRVAAAWVVALHDGAVTGR